MNIHYLLAYIDLLVKKAHLSLNISDRLDCLRQLAYLSELLNDEPEIEALRKYESIESSKELNHELFTNEKACQNQQKH